MTSYPDEIDAALADIVASVADRLGDSRVMMALFDDSGVRLFPEAGSGHAAWPVAAGERVRMLLAERPVTTAEEAGLASLSGWSLFAMRHRRDRRLHGALCVGASLDEAARQAVLRFARMATEVLASGHRLLVLKDEADHRRRMLDGAIDDAIITFDLQGHITGWNMGAQHVLGWPAAEILGRRIDTIFVSEDVASGRPHHEMKQARETGRASDERWHRRKDGSRFWASGEMLRLEDDDGRQIGYIKLLRDRTQLRKTRLELGESRQQVTDALRTGLLGFFSWDGERRLLHGDAHCAGLLGISADVLEAGVSWEMIAARVPPESTYGGREIDAWLGDTPERAIALRQPDDSVRYLLWEGHKRDGGYGGLVVDVTAALKAQEALRVSEAFMHRMLASSNDVIQLHDLKGYLTFISEGGLRAMELETPTPLLNRDWTSLWRGEAGQRAAAQALAAAQAGQVGRFSAYAETGKGNARFWEVVVTPILGKDGHPERLLSVARDQTLTNQAIERMDIALDAGAILGTWRYDPVRDEITGDARMAQVLRISPARLETGVPLGMFYERIAASDIDMIHRALMQAREHSEAFRVEFRVHEPGGGWRWIEASGRRNHVMGDLSPMVCGILLDIEARKRETARQEALVSFGDGLRALDDIDEMLRLCGAVLGRVLKADQAGFGDVDDVRELVTVQADWRAHAIQRSVVGLHAFSAYGQYVDALKRGEVVAVDDIESDGRIVDTAPQLRALGIRAFMNVPLIDAGRLIAIVFVHFPRVYHWTEGDSAFAQAVADRTWAAIRQTRAQVALRRINETLEEQVARRTRERDNIWSITGDLLAVFDRLGCLRRINPSWRHALGYTPEELLGRAFETLVHPDDIEAAAQAMRRLRAAQPVRQLDLRLRHRDGTWRMYNWSGVPQGAEIYSIGRDVTDRIELEEQLRQAQKMEAVGQLTGGLAHDFNNLLSGIGGGLELLSRRIAQGRTDGLMRYIASAQNAAGRAAALTHRLLAFSRRQMLDPRPTDVNTQIEGMIDLIRGTIGPSVTLDVRLQPGLRRTLVDPNQLENTLLNLCINARDAMPDGGCLSITTTNCDLRGTEARDRDLMPGPYLVLSVSDTGVGMAPEILARAFDPFFTTKPLGQGTGLGLSMIYGFARQSGGRVDIESRIGQGTTVRLMLPKYLPVEAVSETSPSQEAVADDLATVGALDVLLVDDEPTVRLVARETLQEMGFTVHEAADGLSALAILQDRDRTLDFLVTDVGLPGGMNGRQLADAARVVRPGLRTLFITGYAEQAVFADRVLEDNMRVLVKPFTMDALRSQVRLLLQPEASD